MILELPLTSDPAQGFTCQLGDAKFYFETSYNSRSETWVLSLSDDATGTQIFTGVPLVIGVDLLDPYNLPYGALIAKDKTGQGLEAGADDLGSRVALYWVSPDETFT